MQRNETFYPGRGVPPLSYEVGCGYTCSIPLASVIDPTLHPGLFHGVEFQASEICPKGFIIFDLTDNKSRIMFHPALATNQFSYPSFDNFATCAQENDKSEGKDKDNESSSLKEDTRDIDALMSLEVDDDEEEVSTGRTMGNCGSISPDSFVSHSKKRKTKLSSIQKSFSFSSGSDSSSNSNNKMKQKRMKKMIKALRGIVPGGDRMDSAVILDEAVRYLKSMKVELKKLGTGDFKKT